jgi:hypothetical protein
MRVVFVCSVGFLVVAGVTGFRFWETGSESTNAEVFDAELQRIQADARAASISDGPAYVSARN